MFTQLLHYVQLALNKGETVPTFLAVIDTEKAALMKSADVLPFLSKKTIRWGKSASQYTQEALDEISATGLHLGISALSAATKLPPATPRKTHFVAVSAMSRHTLRQHRYQVGVHAHSLGRCPGHEPGVQALGNARHKAARLTTGTGFWYRVSTLCGNA